MSVLKKLGNIIKKNDIENKILVSTKLFQGTRTTAQPTTKQPEKTDPMKLYQENNDLVGKDSQFQRALVKDYLSTFKDVRDFTRQTINNDYDIERVKKFRYLKDKISLNPKFKETQDEIFLSRIIPILTREKRDIHVNRKQQLHIQDRLPEDRFIYPRDSYDEIPPVPNFQEDPDLFANYIGLLTHTTFHYRNSSSASRLVPILLRTLLHPMNETTRPYQTTETYNDLLYYYLCKNDMASMRETFILLQLAECKPNVKTFNLMLTILLRNSRNSSSPNTTRNVIYYLQKLFRGGIIPNEATWGILFQFLETDKGRSTLIETMKEMDIGMSYRFLIMLIREMDSMKEMSGLSILKLFQQYEIRMNYSILSFVIRRFLEQKQSNHALTTINHIIEQNKRSGSVRISINAQILNLLLGHFANGGRLDLALMTYNSYILKGTVEPDPQMFDWLYKSLVKNGYFKDFPVVAHWIKLQRLKYTREMRNSYWKLKSDSIVKFNCLKKWNEKDADKFEEMMQRFVLSKEQGYDTWRKSNSDLRKILRYINCRPNKQRDDTKASSSLITATSDTRKQKLEYRKSIRKIAIKKASIERIPYAKDWYSALNTDLRNRNII
ncbi:mitochondrial translation initiation protein [Maudiozyma exigua]|uniref:Mitochondrial translation initiation protein n=1 Tax=Maudiozyma exigua TaxID=34358 RepID=A0A9P6WER3_MAUEX|nr:mitochondrial translation initiation protein [Kazachstania exigua]